MKTPPPLPSGFVPPPVIKPAPAANWQKSHLIIGILGLTALILLLLIVLFSTGVLGPKKAEWQKPFNLKYNNTNFSLVFDKMAYGDAYHEGNVRLNVFYSYKNLGPREGFFYPRDFAFEAKTKSGHIYTATAPGINVGVPFDYERDSYGGKINGVCHAIISFEVPREEKIVSISFLRDKSAVFVMALPEPPLLVADKPGTTVR